MEIITFTNTTDFKHSYMTAASQNDCKLTAYKFSNSNTRTVTKTERLPTKGTRSRNPQPINNRIIVQH